MVQPNWPVFLYFPAFLLAFLLTFRLYGSLRASKLKNIMLYFGGLSFLTGIAFSLIIFIAPYYPVFRPFINIKISKSPLRDMLGWKEMAAQVDKILSEHKKDDLLIATRRFQTASELAYYVKGKPQTYSFNYFMRDNEYSLWNDFKNKKGRNFLYVINTKYGKRLEKSLCRNFSSCYFIKKISIKNKYGQTIRTIKFYILKDFLYKDKFMFQKFSSKEF